MSPWGRTCGPGRQLSIERRAFGDLMPCTVDELVIMRLIVLRDRLEPRLERRCRQPSSTRVAAPPPPRTTTATTVLEATS